MKITVVGLGYVGLSNAVLLAQNCNVIALDVDHRKVTMVNQKISPIEDRELECFLKRKNLNLKATLDKQEAYIGSDFVIIATPTDYNANTNVFDTKSVEEVITDVLHFSPQSTIIIKSTVPVGYTESIKDTLNCDNIIFSPEFLREGRALYDCLHPSRIVIGEKSTRAKKFADILVMGAIRENIEVLFTKNTEAEAIKLFSNTYLAMRVAFFNELDTYAFTHELETQQIIDGVCGDPRIGGSYNNPSFGYGGYCFPKDTKQLLANFANVPQNLISAVVNSNETRIKFIAGEIIKIKSKSTKKDFVVGVYRLIMKAGSDNTRSSSTIGVIDILKKNGINILVHEPQLKEKSFGGYDVEKDIEKFIATSDIIIANRRSPELMSAEGKLYTRDLFGDDI